MLLVRGSALPGLRLGRPASGGRVRFHACVDVCLVEGLVESAESDVELVYVLEAWVWIEFKPINRGAALSAAASRTCGCLDRLAALALRRPGIPCTRLTPSSLCRTVPTYGGCSLPCSLGALLVRGPLLHFDASYEPPA